MFAAGFPLLRECPQIAAKRNPSLRFAACQGFGERRLLLASLDRAHADAQKGCDFLVRALNARELLHLLQIDVHGFAAGPRPVSTSHPKAPFLNRTFHLAFALNRAMNGVAMATFTIDSDNNITAHAGLPAGADESQSFTTQKELAKLTADWPVSRLIDTWNSFAGAAPFNDLKPVKKFTNRKAAVARGSGRRSSVWPPTLRNRRRTSRPPRERRRSPRRRANDATRRARAPSGR